MRGEYRRGLGTISPTLFIGLGGIGTRIVDRIAGRAVRLPDWESRLRPLTSFVSIDSNELDQHRLSHIPAGNRLNIAAFDKVRALEYFRRSQDQQVLQWLAYQPRPAFKPGAGQIRIESRLGFFYHSQDIRQRLRELVLDSLRPGITWRQSQPPRFNVHLFCSLAGGTGSGSFLSVAYLVDALIRTQGWQPRMVANLLLSTLLLDRVAPELHPDIHANAYAALKELEHLTRLDYRQVKDEGRRFEELAYGRDENSSSIPRVTSRPFFISFLFDRPAHFTLPDAEMAIADAAFLQVFTPISDNLAGELDNYEKGLETLTRLPGGASNPGQGYTRNFGSFGAAALVLPGHDLLEYSALRFAAQAIRGQITFGIDRSDPVDDRARALALLAVDYAGPEFLKMLDVGREQAIHQTFIDSVHEMARQDARLGQTDSFWYQLAESIDSGPPIGVDDRGERVRGEAIVHLVERKLSEARRELLDRVSIRERSLAFGTEEVNQYVEHVSRFVEDVRAARRIVDEGVRGLEMDAEEGKDVADLKLDPISERYLVYRLLEHCADTWLPEVRQQLESAKQRDLDNPRVRERLESELFESLREAAVKRSLFRKQEAFLDARQEAQKYLQSVASAAREVIDAEIRLRQLHALLKYLMRRTRWYARLATHLDAVVQELESRAERLRRGESALTPALALRVEIFETLVEPRQRIWDRVYRVLFLEGGRSSNLFDFRVLLETISGKLKAEMRDEGRNVERPVGQIAAEVQRALHNLGRELLAPAIFGSADQPGIDMVRGLELEARLMLAPLKQPEEDVTEAEIDDYQERKLGALTRMAGILARIDSPETRPLDDGVKPSRTRQLLVGLGETSSSKASEYFISRLQAVLAEGRRQVKVDRIEDPHLIIVHDAELPIPLYSFEPVTREIESSYLHLKAADRRSYPVHTDFHWEESLPNLNPRRPEILPGLALKTFARGLASGAISYREAAGGWQATQGGKSEILGESLAGAMYRLDQFRGTPWLAEISEGAGAPPAAERRQACVGELESMLAEIETRALAGDMTRNDFLDRPLLHALIRELWEGMDADQSTRRSVPKSE